MKTAFKIISTYSFINVIIAYAFELVSPLSYKIAQLISTIFALFINVFSYVAIPLLFAAIVLAVYYFVQVICDKDRLTSFKYMVINVVNVVSIAYFVALAAFKM